jgi:hypothetical protein
MLGSIRFMVDQHYYEIVAEELQRRFLRPGLWTRAVAESGGEGDAARALYIRLRVLEIVQIEQAEHARAVAESRQRADEEVQARKRAQEEEDHLRLQQQADEQLCIDRERAASPFFGWFVIASTVFLLILLVILGCVLSK